MICWGNTQTSLTKKSVELHITKLHFLFHTVVFQMCCCVPVMAIQTVRMMTAGMRVVINASRDGHDGQNLNPETSVTNTKHKNHKNDD